MATQVEHGQIAVIDRLARTTDFLKQKPETIQEDAPSLMNQWIVELRGVGLDVVADELGRLQDAVIAEDEAAVGDCLQNLVRMTHDEAGKAKGPLAEHLTELAGSLNRLEQKAVDRPQY